jgi:sarcosine oxidase subunit beta
MANTADVLIVGGGVMGLAIAQALAQRKAGRVVVLEKSFIGAGSSGKSGAIIRQHYSNPLTARMAQLSLKVFERFHDIYGGPPVFTRTGLVIIVQRKDQAALERNLAMQQGLGIQSRMVSAEDLKEIDPIAHLDAEELAAYEPQAGYVEAAEVLASWAAAARRDGADIREGVAVRDLVVEGGRIAGAETSEGRCACRDLILATGPWAAELLRRQRIALPVQACRTQVALFRKPAPPSAPGATYGDFAQGIYFKPTHGEQLHAGSIAGEEINEPVNPDDYDDSADPQFTRSIKRRLDRRYPALCRGYGRGGYGALYAVTPDWHPIIDKLPGVEGAWCAVGFSGHGFKLSPLVSQLVAEMVIDGAARSLDIRPLRLARFAENDPVKIPHAYGVMA